MPPGTRANKSVAVAIPDLARFKRDLAEFGDSEDAAEFKDANVAVATLVIDKAKIRASTLGRMERRASETLRAVRSGVRAELNYGGTDAKRYGFTMGAEFGAYRNKLRLRKNTGGRAYIVRKESRRQIAKAIKRIEAQTRDSGNQSTIARRQFERDNGIQARITGRVRGWNQFEPWTGNGPTAGRFLFPAIRGSEDEIREQYLEAIDKLASKAFPEGTT